jgi:DNA invertase Pin-like site-specific DNA recombinase
LCASECQRRGWAFNENLCISDLGVSAFNGNNFDRRFALGKFIEASKQNLLLPNPTILIENLDRFSRDILDSADTEFWGLVKRGVDILVLSMGGDPFTKGDENNAVKRAIVMFEFDRAHRESQRKSELIQSVVTKKIEDAKEGKSIGLGGWIPCWVIFQGKKLQEGKYIQNPKNWDTVESITKKYFSGLSMNAIAKELHRAKTPVISGRGHNWTQSSIRHILTNPALTGSVTINHQTFKNYIPAILNEKQWKKLQTIIKQNNQRKGGVGKGGVANIFANRCQCFRCKGTVGVCTMQQGKRSYLFCRNARMDGECSTGMIQTRSVELDFFLHYLQESPGDLMRKNNTEHEEKIAHGQSVIMGYDKEIAKIMSLLETLPIAELRSKLTTLENKRQAAKEELEKINAVMLSSGNAPRALQSVKDIISEMGGNTTGHIDRESKEYAKLVDRISLHLNNQETRKKLLSLLPSLIKGLIVDTTGKRYAVVNHSGNQSNWRKV